MALFFLLAALLVVLVLALLLPAFSRQEVSTVAVSRTDTNVAIAKAQAAEFKRRLDAGEISAADYQDEMARIEVGLARDIEPENASSEKHEDQPTGQWMLWPVAAALPIAAGLLYLTLGTPAAIDPANRVAPQVAQPQQAPPDMQQIVAEITQRLEQQPDDARGWFMLGRAFLTTGEYEKAVGALRTAHELDRDNVDVKIRLADAIALTQQGSLLGEPVQLLKSALETNPEHPQGLWLYGMAINEAGEHEVAVTTWTKLLSLLPEDPQSTAEVERLIAGAKQQMAAGSANTASQSNTAVAPTSTAAATGSVNVLVEVKDGLAAGLPADTAVYVYAKAASGPPMPLAVVKLKLGDLPLNVTLSDAQAMMPAMKISAFKEVIIGARISKGGDPIAQPGDLYAEVAGITTADQSSPVKVTISETFSQ